MSNKYDTVEVTVMSGVDDGKLFQFDPHNLPDGEITIGRDPENVIVIDTDPSVSRFHATMRWQGGSWWLKDKDSKNGTFIEHHSTLQRDMKVRGTVQLHDGQLFRIGKTWLRFQPQEWRVNAG